MFVVLFPVQEKQITKWCWGSCGHGVVGALDLGVCAAVMCHHSPCPHLDREMTEPMTKTDDGEPVFLRKLKDTEQQTVKP
jgi:hypothetical protein